MKKLLKLFIIPAFFLTSCGSSSTSIDSVLPNTSNSDTSPVTSTSSPANQTTSEEAVSRKTLTTKFDIISKDNKETNDYCEYNELYDYKDGDLTLSFTNSLLASPAICTGKDYPTYYQGNTTTDQFYSAPNSLRIKGSANGIDGVVTFGFPSKVVKFYSLTFYENTYINDANKGKNSDLQVGYYNENKEFTAVTSFTEEIVQNEQFYYFTKKVYDLSDFPLTSILTIKNNGSGKANLDDVSIDLAY